MIQNTLILIVYLLNHH